MFRGITPIILVLLFISLLSLNLHILGENHYLNLANSLISGNVSLTSPISNYMDVSQFRGQFYWTPGPFPAVLFIPIAQVFKMNFSEGFLKFPLTLLIFYLVYKIAKSLKLSKEKSHLLAIFYVFGSSYTPIAMLPFSVYLSAIVANAALLWAILEFLNRKRYLLIAIAISLATLSRYTQILALAFFAPYLLQNINLKKLSYFALPITFFLIILAGYNFARFGNILETGYKYQLLREEQQARRDIGLFSKGHIPTNLYYMLIKTPDPILSENSHTLKFPYIKYNDYGTSIFFLSPVLFLLFRANFKQKLAQCSSLVILLMLIPITTYYGIGYKQIGYWHSLDFFPFLLLILIPQVAKTSVTKIRLLVYSGVAITWFLILQKINVLT